VFIMRLNYIEHCIWARHYPTDESNALFYNELSPFDLIVLHNIYSFFHTQFLIKTNSVFVSDQIYRNILLAACDFEGCFH